MAIFTETQRAELQGLSEGEGYSHLHGPVTALQAKLRSSMKSVPGAMKQNAGSVKRTRALKSYGAACGSAIKALGEVASALEAIEDSV